MVLHASCCKSVATVVLAHGIALRNFDIVTQGHLMYVWLIDISGEEHG